MGEGGIYREKGNIGEVNDVKGLYTEGEYMSKGEYTEKKETLVK